MIIFKNSKPSGSIARNAASITKPLILCFRLKSISNNKIITKSINTTDNMRLMVCFLFNFFPSTFSSPWGMKSRRKWEVKDRTKISHQGSSSRVRAKANVVWVDRNTGLRK